jgi:hypothetical protein
MPKEQNISNQRFGKWLTVRKVGGGRPRGAMWLCRCDCGAERVVSSSSLRFGNSTNCGCGRAEDLSGQSFGRWTVLARGENEPNRMLKWLCVCKCGTERLVRGAALKNGTSTSCHGCKRSHEYMAERNIWRMMLRRCQDPEDLAYPGYGGRGIAVCKRWQTFENFYADMGPRPSVQMTLERKDNNGPYSPQNCEWLDRIAQANNRRSNRVLTFRGKTQTIQQWARETGIKRSTIWMRLAKGWPIELALTAIKHSRL